MQLEQAIYKFNYGQRLLRWRKCLTDDGYDFTSTDKSYESIYARLHKLVSSVDGLFRIVTVKKKAIVIKFKKAKKKNQV